MEVLRQLAPMYSLRGHRMEVLSLDDPEAPYVAAFPARVHALGPVTANYGFCRQFGRWLRTHASRYDIAVINGIWNYASFGAWRALRGSQLPYVVFTHGMLDPWFKHNHPLKHIMKWVYWPWADYRVLKDAKAVLFTTEEERILARRSFWLYKAKETVVSYGTARPPSDSDRQLASFLERFPHLRDKRVVLFMGRIHPKKGCDLAIEAFARVFANNEDYHLVIAGPDQVGWRATLEDLAKRLNVSNQITWTGMLRADQKWGAIRASEVFFFPSHQENFGIVVAEALACGVPTLISDKVNIWREVQADRAGFAAADNLSGAASLLRKWLELPNERKIQMRVDARKCFEQRFEIDKVSTNLLYVLTSIASEKRVATSPAREMADLSSTIES